MLFTSWNVINTHLDVDVEGGRVSPHQSSSLVYCRIGVHRTCDNKERAARVCVRMLFVVSLILWLVKIIRQTRMGVVQLQF